MTTKFDFVRIVTTFPEAEIEYAVLELNRDYATQLLEQMTLFSVLKRSYGNLSWMEFSGGAGILFYDESLGLPREVDEGLMDGGVYMLPPTVRLPVEPSERDEDDEDFDEDSICRHYSCRQLRLDNENVVITGHPEGCGDAIEANWISRTMIQAAYDILSLPDEDDEIESTPAPAHNRRVIELQEETHEAGDLHRPDRDADSASA